VVIDGKCNKLLLVVTVVRCNKGTLVGPFSISFYS